MRGWGCGVQDDGKVAGQGGDRSGLKPLDVKNKRLIDDR